jgi:DNA-binding GntR family transcriptional regulator
LSVEKTGIRKVERPATLADLTARSIRDAIFADTFKPGEPLREEKLSESLGVSRNTVREALRILQDDGLVEIIPHQGAFLVRTSARTIEEVYALRIVLEPYLVRYALENACYNQDYLKGLEDLLSQMGNFEGKDDVLSTIKVDQRFHQLMCEPSDLQLMLAALKSVGYLTRVCMINLKLHSADLVADELQHREILDAIRQGDPVHGEQVVRKHLENARDQLLGRMTAGSGEGLAEGGPANEV